MQQAENLKEIEHLRMLLQRLRTQGHARSEQVHDKALLTRFLNLRASIRFNKHPRKKSKVRKTGFDLSIKGGVDLSVNNKQLWTTEVSRRKARNAKFTKYDGTTMAERRLLQEEKLRKKREAIEERKRQKEEAELMNCSFDFKARKVPSSSSTNRMHLTRTRLSALKGSNNEVTLGMILRRIIAKYMSENPETKNGAPQDLKGVFTRYCRVAALKRTSQKVGFVKTFATRRTMDMHQFKAFLRDYGFMRPGSLTAVRATLIFQRRQDPKTKMIVYKGFVAAMEEVVVELGLTFEECAARILDHQLTNSSQMPMGFAETKRSDGAGK